MTEQEQRILVVDDDQDVRITLFDVLHRSGYEVGVADNGSMALEAIKKNPPAMVITDIRMPEMDGVELIARIRQLQPDLPVVVITAYGAVETAINAMKMGAVDYILKPFPPEVIEHTVDKIFSDQQIPSSLDVPPAKRKENTDSGSVKPIVGKDPKILWLMEKARKVASSKATVLILGESGTGKEVFARYIHTESNRRAGPFVALNCAALPEGLLESELFGHEKGAFTGAISMKKGKFELADGGTLLLDEISEIPLHLQAKLLRVLQEEEVDRLGGKAPVKVDVHVVATTNRSLDLEVKEGRFREDLFYRLNVIPLRLPPLRERQGDLMLLAKYFIAKYTSLYGMEEKRLSAASKKHFRDHKWPGNVREMENLIERAVLLSSGDLLEPGDFLDEGPGEFPVADAAPTDMRNFVNDSGGEGALQQVADGEVMPLKDVERQLILQALQKTDNNRTHAAKMLGVSVRTLRNKLHEYRSQGIID